MADRYLLESGAPDGYQLEDGSGVLLLEDPVVPSPNRLILATIAAAWSVVMAVPVFSAVLLQPVPVDTPPPTHEARTVAVQAQVLEAWQGADWSVPRARTVPPVAAAPSADSPPVNTAPAIQKVLAVHYADGGFRPLWSAALAQPVPVDPPPPTHEARTVAVQAQVIEAWQAGTQWSLPPSRKLVPGGPALSADTVLAVCSVVAWQWDAPTWAAQARPKLAPALLDVPVNAPPYTSRNPQRDSILLAWQPGPPMPPRSGPVPQPFVASAVNEPPYASAGRAQQDVLVLTWSPTLWNAQARPKLVSALLDVPVNDPPYTSRNPQRDSILLAWQPGPPMPPRSGPVPQPFVASAGDGPPHASAGRAQQEILVLAWPPTLWDAQARPKLPVVVPAVSAQDPPFSSQRFRVERLWEPIAWTIAPRGLLVQPTSPPAVNDPPFASSRVRAEHLSILAAWTVEPRRLAIQPELPPVILLPVRIVPATARVFEVSAGPHVFVIAATDRLFELPVERL